MWSNTEELQFLLFLQTPVVVILMKSKMSRVRKQMIFTKNSYNQIMWQQLFHSQQDTLVKIVYYIVCLYTKYRNLQWSSWYILNYFLNICFTFSVYLNNLNLFLEY